MELRKEVKKYIDHADDKVVKMVHAMPEANAEVDWWESLPPDVKTEIEISIQEADEGKVISHKMVKAKYPQMFSK